MRSASSAARRGSRSPSSRPRQARVVLADSLGGERPGNARSVMTSMPTGRPRHLAIAVFVWLAIWSVARSESSFFMGVFVAGLYLFRKFAPDETAYPIAFGAFFL